ncbi:hypothetical protein [Paraburkholderia phenoliruptrix]|uniref:hypothetical protein n=1 Tax=Paraburkholderia phenoliruptrix TaxID=252970 RepID=UPI001C6E0752|nr:hypothetical protein [Paraburkholderia phenoliruptrix]MBW9105083.1 hypothetical protein [Paraburkholderia phenoliruptrix]MBW9129729.1 hypothetical protein [Paraburkholderia ginsengiterrae]
MRDRTLNAMQVGAMLISTSCGVGFFVGTGEQAMVEGMAGCLYAVATALGLTLLAACAPTFWRTGRSIWSQFNGCYGPSVGRNAAALSLVWMTGVLAAQIRGGSAVLALTGLSRTSAEAVIIVLLLALSIVRLSWLSVGFACCLIACNVLLLLSLIEPEKIDIWLMAPATFAKAFQQGASAHTGFVLVSVAVMVVCGADYQQFAMAARTPSSARAGSLVAAALVLAMGFLLVSAVVAARQHGDLQRANDPIQVVPVLLVHSLPGGATTTAQAFVITLLVGAALGSASSILRAMSDAVAMFGRPSVMRPFWSRALPALLGIVVASRQQSLVDMMVGLNLIYIAAVAPLLALSLLHVSISGRAANTAMAIACAISLADYLIRWETNTALPEVPPLLASIAAALAVVGLYRAGDRLQETIGTSARSRAQPSTADSYCSRDAEGG